jgi:hypothetical protein
MTWRSEWRRMEHFCDSSSHEVKINFLLLFFMTFNHYFRYFIPKCKLRHTVWLNVEGIWDTIELKLITYLLIYLLTPWSRVLLEKVTGLQLVKKFPTLYGTRRLITAFTSARHLSLSWASSIRTKIWVQFRDCLWIFCKKVTFSWKGVVSPSPNP